MGEVERRREALRGCRWRERVERERGSAEPPMGVDENKRGHHTVQNLYMRLQKI
jgi:hypothetical protein